MMNGGIEKRPENSDASPDGPPSGQAGNAEAEIGEAFRLARHVNDLLARAAVMSNAKNAHHVRIAQAISESLVDELEVVIGRSDRRRIT